MADSKASSMPWIEKYRPRTLKDIAHQEEAVDTLKRSVESGNLPHLLFYGPPGTGKTSTILAVARELYGPELMRSRVLELNASNERGIDVIRYKVKQFAQLAVGKASNVSGYPCPPYKIIVLDEADSMTRDAQSALRRTMEQYTRVTRFCIICNYVSRIIQPITSRCAKFRYKPLSEGAMVARLSHIATSEGIRANAAVMQSLVQVSMGDMRKSITLLQSAQRLVCNGEIDVESVEMVAGTLPARVVQDLLTACKQNSFIHVERAAKDTIAAGYPVDQLIQQLQPVIIEAEDLSDMHKAKICIRLAEADKKLHDSADEYLQLMDVLSLISCTIVK